MRASAESGYARRLSSKTSSSSFVSHTPIWPGPANHQGQNGQRQPPAVTSTPQGLEWSAMAFADALRALNTMKADGVIQEYAVAGGLALVFWTEPVATYDLGVLVFLPSAGGPLVSLESIYRWASAHGYRADREHILIEGVPAQFLPSPSKLADEAIETADTLDYQGVPTRVALPEYLVALYLQPGARSAKRRERVAMLLEWRGLNRNRLDAILDRHGLSL